MSSAELATPTERVDVRLSVCRSPWWLIFWPFPISWLEVPRDTDGAFLVEEGDPFTIGACWLYSSSPIDEFHRVVFGNGMVRDCFGFGHNRWVAVEGTVGQTIRFSVELFDGNTRLELEHGVIRVV